MYILVSCVGYRENGTGEAGDAHLCRPAVDSVNFAYSAIRLPPRDAQTDLWMWTASSVGRCSLERLPKRQNKTKTRYKVQRSTYTWNTVQYVYHAWNRYGSHVPPFFFFSSLLFSSLFFSSFLFLLFFFVCVSCIVKLFILGVPAKFDLLANKKMAGILY